MMKIRTTVCVSDCTKTANSSCHFFPELPSFLSWKASLCNFTLPPPEKGALQPNPPLPWDWVHHSYPPAWPLLSRKTGVGVWSCSRDSEEQAAAMPTAVLGSWTSAQLWGPGMPKYAPDNLSATRSPENGDRGFLGRETCEASGRLAKLTREGLAWGGGRDGSGGTRNPLPGRARFAPSGGRHASLDREGPSITGAKKNQEKKKKKRVFRSKSSDKSPQDQFYSVLPPARSRSKHQPAVYSPSPKVQRVRCEHSQ